MVRQKAIRHLKFRFLSTLLGAAAATMEQRWTLLNQRWTLLNQRWTLLIQRWTLPHHRWMLLRADAATVESLGTHLFFRHSSVLPCIYSLEWCSLFLACDLISLLLDFLLEFDTFSLMLLYLSFSEHIPLSVSHIFLGA